MQRQKRNKGKYKLYKMHNFIVPYTSEWEYQFNNLRNVYAAHLADIPYNIEHIGSTSIKGMVSKPILDIDIILNEKRNLDLVTERLEILGYESKGDLGVHGRFAFRQKTEFTPIESPLSKWYPHHLYVCFKDSVALKNHLLFRDSLRKDANLLNQYIELKLKLTNNASVNRKLYGRLKTDFVLTVLEKAGLSRKELFEIRQANS